MRRKISQIFILFLLFTILAAAQAACAEGIFPPWSEVEGIGMPSLSESLRRYPDSEIKNEDGSVTYVYSQISEEDYNTFSNYLGEQGAELTDYQIKRGVLSADLSFNNAAFSLTFDRENGEAKITYPAETYDQWIKKAKTHYTAAGWLLEDGMTEDAATEILMIPQYGDYSPVKELLQSNDKLTSAIEVHEEKIKPYRTVGNMVVFGSYEQDFNFTNGTEPIEWIVLDYDGKENKALLLSRYCLVAMGYDGPESEVVRWDLSAIRKRLNSEFLMSAFSEKEQSAILTTDVDNSPSQGCPEFPNKDSGDNTQDKIFLLSYAEAHHYLDAKVYDDSMKPRAAATDFAHRNGDGIYFKKWHWSDVTVDGEMCVEWWLRSPGSTNLMATTVNPLGAVNEALKYTGEFMVRPALWLNLNVNIY